MYYSIILVVLTDVVKQYVRFMYKIIITDSVSLIKIAYE